MKHKRLFFSTLFLVVMALTAVVFNSCEKERDINNQNQETNFLSFSNYDEYTNTLDSLNALSPLEAGKYKNEDGFISMLNVYNQFLKEIEDSISAQEYNDIFGNYSDILNDNEAPRLKITNSYVVPLVNRKGLIKIADVLYLFNEDAQYISLNGSIDELYDAVKSGKETQNVKINFYSQNIELKSTSSTCGPKFGNDAYNGNRKAHIWSMIWTDYYWDTYSKVYKYDTRTKTEGIPYKKVLGKWKQYSTRNTLTTIHTIRLTNGQVIDTDKTYSNDWNAINWSFKAFSGYTSDFNDIVRGTYTYMNSSYNHRGMDGAWVDIDCPHN